jgi:hypothetical protein
VKEAYNKSLHPPPGASVTALAFATAAPNAGEGELRRYAAAEFMVLSKVCYVLERGPPAIT